MYPHWLEPVADAFRRADAGEPVRALLSVPPQFGKTELALHGLTWLQGRNPRRRSAYASYNITRGQRMSRRARQLAQRSGIAIAQDARAAGYWETAEGGYLIGTGIGGALTGFAVDGVLVVDDPHKDRRDANSPVMREHVWDWYTDVARTRVHPGASIFVIHTRWHTDDLIGRLAEHEGWETINLPALDDEGRSLAPELKSAEFLEDVRREVGEYTWWSLYQGQPRPKGGELFGTPATCRMKDIPPVGQMAIGLDLAYSAKTSADYSVAVVLRRANGKAWVVHVERHQKSTEHMAPILVGLQARYPGAKTMWDAGGTEVGVAKLLNAMGARIGTRPAVRDKYVRAQPAAAAWRAGDIVVPTDAPWAGKFLDEVQRFTGLDDKHDDQVDALASAFDTLPKHDGLRVVSGGKGTHRGRSRGVAGRKTRS